MIPLKLSWAFSGVAIDDQCRPWITTDEVPVRRNWKVLWGLPHIVLGGRYVSARTLAKRQQRENEATAESALAIMMVRECDLVDPQDTNQLLNEKVLEALKNGYFLKRRTGANSISWYQFTLEDNPTLAPPIETPEERTRRDNMVFDFLRPRFEI